MVVVTSIAKNENCGLRSDFTTVLFPKDLECVAVIGMAIDPNDIGLGIHPMNRNADVLDALEILRYFIEPIDKDKGSNSRELPGDCVNELQRKASERRN
ncbi:unannotated protein [freshwater metagenome]|uniref:Unannotated protein n=1 Tax=freshwater metagenome TaxID=449393 RepID=A0A6J6F7U4_9ZZZZ